MSTVQLKRSATASKVPLVTDLQLGELALNTYDGRIFFKKDPGTPSIVTVATTADTQTFTNKTLTSPVITGTITANSSVGSAGQVLASSGSGVYWSTPTTGTVTSVATGSGLTGGTITATGTVSVLANTGIIANATGLYVNSAYIATIAANSATYVLANTGIVSNATGVYVNSAYIATISANNTTYFNGYTWAAPAALGSSTANTGQFTTLTLTTNTATFGTTSYFVANGNVGIGTSSPAYTLQVAGSFAATTKSFVIDHPTKPDMKLRYGSLEGPENGVYVRGRIVYGNTITLPDHWEGLVDSKTITVSLTPIRKTSMPSVVSWDNKSVVIESDGEIDCFYHVFGERKDVDKLVVEF